MINNTENRIRETENQKRHIGAKKINFRQDPIQIANLFVEYFSIAAVNKNTDQSVYYMSISCTYQK